MAYKVIEVRGVCKRIGGQLILNNINLDIYQGEIFGLIGPNGAGKTTLMRILAGLMRADCGNVDGSSVLTDKIGVLLEYPAAYGWLSGRQNLKIIADMYRGVTEQDIDEIVQLVGLEEAIQKKYRTYSAGMKQRLGIAMALMNKPNLIILDEPMNGLDFDGICKMRGLIVRLAKENGCAIILSGHMLDEMGKICNRAAFIQEGIIVDVVDGDIMWPGRLEDKYREVMGVKS